MPAEKLHFGEIGGEAFYVLGGERLFYGDAAKGFTAMGRRQAWNALQSERRALNRHQLAAFDIRNVFSQAPEQRTTAKEKSPRRYKDDVSGLLARVRNVAKRPIPDQENLGQQNTTPSSQNEEFDPWDPANYLNPDGTIKSSP